MRAFVNPLGASSGGRDWLNVFVWLILQCHFSVCLSLRAINELDNDTDIRCISYANPM